MITSWQTALEFQTYLLYLIEGKSQTKTLTEQCTCSLAKQTENKRGHNKTNNQAKYIWTEMKKVSKRLPQKTETLKFQKNILRQTTRRTHKTKYVLHCQFMPPQTQRNTSHRNTFNRFYSKQTSGFTFELKHIITSSAKQT